MSTLVHRCSHAVALGSARLSRGALKTASYSLMHFVVAMAVAFALTGSWKAALAIGMVEPLVQTGAYTLHERAWARADARRTG